MLFLVQDVLLVTQRFGLHVPDPLRLKIAADYLEEEVGENLTSAVWRSGRICFYSFATDCCAGLSRSKSNHMFLDALLVSRDSRYEDNPQLVLQSTIRRDEIVLLSGDGCISHHCESRGYGDGGSDNSSEFHTSQIDFVAGGFFLNFSSGIADGAGSIDGHCIMHNLM